MIFAPTSGPIGLTPHGNVFKMFVQSATVAVGDVVVTSHAHTTYTYPATTIAQLEAGPFANVRPAEGDQALHNGYIGVVVGLGSEGSGAVGTVVDVQIGGTCKANVTATATVSRGSALTVSDTAGKFDNSTGAAGTVAAAVALEALASGSTALIQVLLQGGFYAPAVV
jgi:hypothetical protein